VVLEAVVAGVPDGVVEPGGALERGLAVQGGVDPPGQRVGAGEGRRLEPTGAELEPVLRRGDLLGRAQPGRRRGGRGQLDVHGHPLVEDAVGARRVDRRHHPAGVAGQVVQVAQGDLDPGQRQPQLRAERGRPGQLARPARAHHREGRAEAAHERQVGVPEHEGADQLRAVLGRAGGEGRGGVGEGRVAGREDRRVVDDPGPGVGDGHDVSLPISSATITSGVWTRSISSGS
jgi:hypothetical protein